MAATLLGKQIAWSMTRDKDGHRDYTIVHLVEADVADGPQVVMGCAGLPAIGAAWAFDNDSDTAALCWPTMKVRHHDSKKGEKHKHWEVEQLFTTKPLDRCQTTSIENPLNEPQKVGGSFVKYTKEVTTDRWGDAIKSSSHEMFRGPQVEFDHNRPTVWVEQNVASLGLSTFAAMVDTVNDASLWGLSARCIKLSNVSWERLLYGVCTYYYKRRFEFDVDFDTFDRCITDEGTKVLRGHWTNCDTNPTWVVETGMDKDDPRHFMRFKDCNDENARVLLNGSGEPLGVLGTGTGTGTGTSDINPTCIDVEYYDESNFLSLNIPASF